MRISDWSSDVCSSDLLILAAWDHGRSHGPCPGLPRFEHRPRLGCVDRAWIGQPHASGRYPPCPLRLCPLPSMTGRSEEHTSELQSLMRSSYAVFCFKKKQSPSNNNTNHPQTMTLCDQMTSNTEY